MIRKILLFATTMVAMINALALADVMINQPAPDFTLTDSLGKEHRLSDYQGKYVVLEWVNYDCPFVKKHYQSGNMQNIQQQLVSEDVVWLSINSSAEGKQGHFTPAQINEIMANSHAVPTAYLIDAAGEVGRLYGAKTTPHMFIIDPDGTLIYQGAIDDQPTFDPADIAKAKNYVLSAMASAKSGEPVADATTTPYGCSVKY
jgi:peroxiredoxin